MTHNSIVKNELFKDVLFQKMGNQWFVFVESVEDSVQYSILPKGLDPHINSVQLYEFIGDFQKTRSVKKDDPVKVKRTLDKSL